MTSIHKFGLAACALFIGSHALDTITVPDVITAGSDFILTVTTSDNDAGDYRVYLDTTPPGYAGGQSCYLENTTSTDITSLTLTIPADFGPSGDFYSISTRDLSDSDNAANYVYSNAFNLTGATGNWSAYENQLNGAPLWNADSLPCSSYNCARECAQDSYPDDVSSDSAAYETMSACIMGCSGVSAKPTTSSSASSVATSISIAASSSIATSSRSSTITTKTRSGSSTSATTSSSPEDDMSASSGSAAAASATQTGAASSNMIPVSFVAAGGVLAFLL